eukprot:Hpha_TRINITY_DN10419_c0_g1::TRINITY_DN10419_c0_g1_i2::g.193362::m.193362
MGRNLRKKQKELRLFNTMTGRKGRAHGIGGEMLTTPAKQPAKQHATPRAPPARRTDGLPLLLDDDDDSDAKPAEDEEHKCPSEKKTEEEEDTESSVGNLKEQKARLLSDIRALQKKKAALCKRRPR